MPAKLASNVVPVYVPSFFIHLKPSVDDGAGIMLFQQNLLFAPRQVEPEIAEVAEKCFYEQALKPINVASSVFDEASPYSVEAVKTLICAFLINTE